MQSAAILVAVSDDFSGECCSELTSVGVRFPLKEVMRPQARELQTISKSVRCELLHTHCQCVISQIKTFYFTNTNLK